MLLDFVRPGNALIVGRVDRLARSLRALPDIVHPLKARGAALRATEQPVDTGAASGKAFLLGRLGVFAGFGTNLRRARQREGIKAAKDPYQRRKAMPAASANMIRSRLGRARCSLACGGTGASCPEDSVVSAGN